MMLRPVRSLLAVLLLSSPLLASGTFIETFTGGVNSAGWTYGPTPEIPPTGGNPDNYLRSFVDTFAPQLRTTAPSSEFTGNYRTKNVSSLGLDLRTINTQFPADRECTLMLSGGGCQVYFLGTEHVPQPGPEWKSIDYAIDPHSTTMPAGWLPLGSCTDPDTAWNTVIENVTEVRFFYGDPTFFFIFDQWTVGMDNARITCGDPWTDLGGGTLGSNGQPTLTGSGPLSAGSTMTLDLTNGPASDITLLWISLTPTPTAAVGGTLHAFPYDASFVLLSDASGGINISASVAAGAPAGTEITFQYICKDAANPHGITLSNGLKGTTP
jgi:hypothetical protein